VSATSPAAALGTRARPQDGAAPGTDASSLRAARGTHAASSGWTGGQYSLVRLLFGTYLFVHFAMLLPWGAELFSNRGVLPDGTASPLLHLFPNVLALDDSPATVTALLGAGLAASVAFAAGFRDRIAALVCWYVLTCVFGRNPLISNPALPFVGWMLLAHAFVPGTAYGAVDARGRIDPRGNWQMPVAIVTAAWVVMSLGYTYSGWTKLMSPSWVDGTAMMRVLDNPLARDTWLRTLVLSFPTPLLMAMAWGALAMELAFAPLALFTRLRPFVWAGMLSMHLGLMTLIDFADLSFGMIVLHLFTFDPRWVPGTLPGTRDDVFYDGTCGVCHGAIRFLLAEDASGSAFRFAPLGGDTFREVIGDRRDLPDSLVLRTQAGAVLLRSDGILHMMARLGGLWRVLGLVASLLPRSLRDRAYDGFARIRSRLAARPTDACPILPPDLRARFSLGTSGDVSEWRA
jgi:predicted DCC family thiol-disulfide oxidoreductase YuxK